MSSTASFGRRVAASPAAPLRVPSAPPAGLSAEAEAFRRGLAEEGAGPSEFARWRRTQRLGRWAAWGLSFALTLPGAACFLFDAPVGVSTLLEAAGLVLGAWLRAARRRRIAEVAAWTPDAPG